MDIKKKHNVNSIISWIATFILLASAIGIVFDYVALKKPPTQATAVFIAEILITVVFMLIMWLYSIQQELFDIKNSLDDSYDLKQINDVRSIVNKRHIEKLLNDIEKTINDIYNGGKINEENQN